jgi:GH25 family lysozyme M1 (1,4-beta-N-acetylmuramidase)
MTSLTRGADFSSYQNDTQLRAALESGIQFAIVKLSQGTDYVNPRSYEQNYTLDNRPAVRAVGGYHFLSHDIDGAAQWDHFETVVRAARITGPLACDQETDNGILVPDAIAKAFIRRGHQRGFKVGRYGDGRVFPRSLGEDWRWCAWWAKTPPPWKWDVWQFQAGAGGAPDWDVFHGTTAQLETWAKRMGAPALVRHKPGWWLHNDLSKAARGPYGLARLGPALIAYLAAHPRVSALRVERK